ncbi:MAG: hypothetical protein ABSC71_00585 [Candidatus Acidiferrales bacterium]|jgi:hypothetical protein
MRLAFVLLGFALVCAGNASAQQQNAAQTTVPHLVQFSGALKDSATRPVAGVSSVTFAIYADQESGAALWSETQNVLADMNGHYSIVLGAATTGGFPVELFGTGQSRWLGVSIARQAEMPRILMASVPYALKAGDAETLGGLPASAYVTTQQLASRTTTPVVTGGSTSVIATGGVPNAQVSPAATSVTANSAPSNETDASPTGSGTTDYIPLWSSGSNLGNSILFESGSKMGLGTTAPQSTLDINGGEILRGGFYEYPQGTADEYFGQPSHSFQWMASLFNSSTNAPEYHAFGFRALPLNNDTANPGAYLDLFYGPGGPDGTLTDTYLSFSSTGVISFVPGQTFNGLSGSLTGPLNSTGGFFVSGDAIGNGLSAEMTSEYAIAVYASASGQYGEGVYADGGDVGIYAEGGTDAGQFSGDVSISGTLSKSSGSFKIDDPIDPANKYLYHSFVESPDMKNVYDGVVTTDTNGLATVTMPDWFEALNSDFRYQLTTVGQFAQAMIAKEIQNGTFTIQTDKPNVKVSWQVTGIRQDAYANAHRIPVEKEKSDAEKGHYIHPELFGHAGELSLPELRPGPDGVLVPRMPPSPPASTKP